MRSTEMLAIAAALALLASTPLAQAQGTSGSTGAVASIPSNIVRAEPGQPVTQPGLLGIIFGSPPPAPGWDLRQKTTRRGQNPLPSK
jgi:hypothetical protein